jgi:hypothetical protein
MSRINEHYGVTRRLRQGYPGVEALVWHWRQEWFRIICLSAVLTLLFITMLFSMYLVMSSPVPSAPETEEQPCRGPHYAAISEMPGPTTGPVDDSFTSG